MYFVFFRRLDLFLGISAAVGIINSLLSIVTFFSFGEILIGGLIKDVRNDPDKIFDHILQYLVEILIFVSILLLANIFTTVLSQAAIAHGVFCMHLDRGPADFVSCLQEAYHRKWSLLGSRFLVYGIVFGPFVGGVLAAQYFMIEDKVGLGFLAMLVAFGLVLYVSLGVNLTTPAVMADGFGPIKGLSRSWKLSARTGCYQFFLVVCLQVLFWAYFTILGMVFDADRIRSLGPFGSHLLAALFVGVPMIFYHSQLAILDAVMYLNIRTDKEGMTPEQLGEDISAEGGSDLGGDNDDDRRVPLLESEPVTAEVLVVETENENYNEDNKKHDDSAAAATPEWVV